MHVDSSFVILLFIIFYNYFCTFLEKNLFDLDIFQYEFSILKKINKQLCMHYLKKLFPRSPKSEFWDKHYYRESN